MSEPSALGRPTGLAAAKRRRRFVPERRTIGFALASAILIAAGVVSFASIQRLSSAGARNERSNQTILELERTLSDLATAQQAERAYIVTNNESFLPPYAAARPSSAAHIATLSGLTAGDPAEAPRSRRPRGARGRRVRALGPGHRAASKWRGEAWRAWCALRVEPGCLGHCPRRCGRPGSHRTTRARTGRKAAEADATRTLILMSALSAGALLLIGGVYFVLRREIRRRRASEAIAATALAEAQDLYDHAPCGYHSLDAAGRFVSINDTELEWLGYAREELVGQKSFQELLTPASLAKLAQQFPPARRSSNASPRSRKPARSRSSNSNFVRKDGSVLPILVSASLATDSEGHYISSRATVFDITSRRESEDRIRTLNSELERHALEVEASNKELEAFSYSVSHDLRAPLRTIDGFSQALVEDYEGVLDDDGKHLLSRIRVATQRMGQLIDDLLQLSRMSRGESSVQPVNLSHLVEQLGEELPAHGPRAARRPRRPGRCRGQRRRAPCPRGPRKPAQQRLEVHLQAPTRPDRIRCRR